MPGYTELIHKRVREHIEANHGTIPKKGVSISTRDEGKDGVHITYYNGGVMVKNELDISRADLDASLEIPEQAIVYIAPAPRQEVLLLAPQIAA